MNGLKSNDFLVFNLHISDDECPCERNYSTTTTSWKTVKKNVFSNPTFHLIIIVCHLNSKLFIQNYNYYDDDGLVFT